MRASRVAATIRRGAWVLALTASAGSALAQGDRDAAWTRADRENDFKGLVGDRKLYEFCHATAFVSEASARYRVTGTNLPEYWPDPKVPPIRWPEAPRESVYRPGMSRGEYFEALCKAEAGEFIFRTVRADSIYMIRPRAEEDDAMGSRYGFEDPYGHGQGDTGDKAAWSLLGTGEGFFTEYGSPDYRVVETPTVRVTINQEGLPTLVLKPEEFDSAMSAMASSLERKYGPPEQYHEKLRKQGYPIDDYLARKAGRGGVR